MDIEMREERRESWGTRAAFVLAAVGSAVGLGNLWGFPYKLYTYGGGAFLIPYIIALVLVGIPMMILEFSLGHYAQRAAPDAFGTAHKRFEMVGWWGIIMGFVIITYYPVILAYCCSYLWYSIKGICMGGELPWAGRGIEGVQRAGAFFEKTYLCNEPGLTPLGALQWHIALPLAITWVAMYLCIFRGVRLVGKIVWLTVPLPWLMLLVLTVRGLTLPGNAEGLVYYLDPKWAELAKPATWRFAFGQVFFSLSLAFGVMITYASFLHKKSDLNNNAAIISLADFGTSFVAGLAVFATLGAMAFATRQAGDYVPVEKVANGGPGLAFVAFPYALAQLPYSAWFSFIFFLALITLGIDSAFSITESVLASVVDKTGWHRNVVLPVMSVIGFALGLVYVTQRGLGWLGTIDGFVNGTWGIALLGLLECVVLGWLYRLERLRNHANERSDWRLGRWWDFFIRILIPIVLGALFVWSLFDDVTNPAGFLFKADGQVHLGNCVGMIVVVLAPVLAWLLGAWKSVKRTDEVALSDHEAHSLGRQQGRTALVLAALAAVLAIAAFIVIARVSRAETGPTPGTTRAGILLAGVALLGLGGLIMAARVVMGQERNPNASATWTLRWAGLLSTLDVGASIGLLLALVTKVCVVAEAPIRAAEEELSGVAFIVLAVVGVLLVVGLGWCFYRAIMAAESTGERTARDAKV
ncbi:MAG: sodium-dependent transporter [Kiritimatiellae bacterium]|nr:sodium-dependent transporter [Kiritimatiellia bacterium]